MKKILMLLSWSAKTELKSKSPKTINFFIFKTVTTRPYKMHFISLRTFGRRNPVTSTLNSLTIPD